jgi:hypothetical protein
VLHVPNLSEVAIDFKKIFWNNMFEKKLPKHKDMLDATFLQPSLKIMNINFSLATYLSIFTIVLVLLQCCEFKICSYINTTKSG